MKVHLVAAAKEAAVVDEFKIYTAMMRREGLLEIVERDQAQVIIAFVSPHLLCDDFCQQDLFLAEHKKQTIIPVIVSPCEWQKDSILSKLQCTPVRGCYLCNDSNGELWMSVMKDLRSALLRIEFEIAKGKS